MVKNNHSEMISHDRLLYCKRAVPEPAHDVTPPFDIDQAAVKEQVTSGLPGRGADDSRRGDRLRVRLLQHGYRHAGPGADQGRSVVRAARFAGRSISITGADGTVHLIDPTAIQAMKMETSC